MAQEIALFGDTSPPVPSHIAELYKPEDSNLFDRSRQPQLSITGKVFSITVDGEKTPLMTQTTDGEQVPLGVLPVVVLDYAKERGRSFYEGEYDPNNVTAPRCWSRNGVTPDDTVPEPIAAKCKLCPNAIKGSKVTPQGHPTVACSEHRILAVIPIKRLDIAPLRLRLAITSDYDGRSPELAGQGKFAFSNYTAFLKARKVPHSQTIVTKISFDPGEAYPKLLFQAARWLSDAELAKVREIAASGGVEEILGDNMAGTTAAASTAPQIAGKPPAGVDDGAAAKAAAAEAERVKAAAAAEEAERVKAAKKAEADAKKAAKAAADKAAADKAAADKAAAAKPGTTAGLGDMGDDDGPDLTLAAPRTETAEAATVAASGTKPSVIEAPATADLPDDVTSLLSAWGED